MFRDKYKSDNKLIIPDQSLISSLAEKMKSYEESNINVLHNDKKSKGLQITFKTASILASCICVLIISAAAFYFIEGTGNTKNQMDITTENTLMNSDIPEESSAKSSVDTSSNLRSKKADTTLGSENKIQSAKQELAEESSSEILISSEIETITISIFSDSKSTSVAITDATNINLITEFFNKLYNEIDQSVLVDVGIDESKGDRIDTSFYQKDGTKKITTLYNDSYFRIDEADWFPVKKESITWYHEFIRSVD